MKTSIIKVAILICTIISFASCKNEDTMKNLNVAPVQTLYDPVNNASVVLQASATASVYFDWQPALSEDGALTLYQVAFDTIGGNFSKPLYVITSDNNGANTQVSITHKQLNQIAALAGIASSATGKLIWTVFASKGINQKIATAIDTLEVTRLAGFANVPNSVYITGAGTEGGSDLSKASDMKSISNGVYEIYTKLVAGQPYYFTDANVGNPRTFYIDSKAILQEGKSTSTVSTTGVYRIDLDFTTGGSTMVQITKWEFYFCPLDQFQFALTYVGNGVWTATNEPINFDQQSWGLDQRYKFRMTYVDNSGTQAYEWWGAPASVDSAPTGVASYYYLYPADDSQWNDKFKFADEMNGALVNMSVIMSASGPYTHSVTKVGMQ
ncbi:SusE domain-containing protein [Microbacter margulisiae]|uniref:SusE outer membrane protein domain-containing protein n=1 Tax=Microbacter margulisiae TaxID=1350067 RepID=A0A7W5H3J5_9PORP|nr:SusE domain-containing protein [Microbacter margulisiae]MBB3188659.1 hypothetical protein [Microbacter margulisiae]